MSKRKKKSNNSLTEEPKISWEEFISAEDNEELNFVRSSEDTSDEFLLYCPKDDTEFIVGFYDYEAKTWLSAETHEEVDPVEYWPLPPFGTGLGNDE